MCLLLGGSGSWCRAFAECSWSKIPTISGRDIGSTKPSLFLGRACSGSCINDQTASANLRAPATPFFVHLASFALLTLANIISLAAPASHKLKPVRSTCFIHCIIKPSFPCLHALLTIFSIWYPLSFRLEILSPAKKAGRFSHAPSPA